RALMASTRGRKARMRLSLAEPNNLRATAPNMPEFLSRPLGRIAEPMDARPAFVLSHSNRALPRTSGRDKPNASMSGPAGCGGGGGVRTLVNWARRPSGLDRASILDVFRDQAGSLSRRRLSQGQMPGIHRRWGAIAVSTGIADCPGNPSCERGRRD